MHVLIFKNSPLGKVFRLTEVSERYPFMRIVVRRFPERVVAVAELISKLFPLHAAGVSAEASAAFLRIFSGEILSALHGEPNYERRPGLLG